MEHRTPKPIIFTDADPTVTRIIPGLAVEIGLSQSIMLLQMAHWIKTATGDIYHDGKWWTYQSLSDMQEKAFSYWDRSTISRVVNSLVDEGYLHKGNFNKRKSDKTQWFALNVDKLEGLNSIRIDYQIQAVANQDTDSEGVAKRNTPLQNATPILQNATTLPETPSETPSETSPQPPTDNNQQTEQGQELEPIQPVYLEYQKFTGNPVAYRDRDLILEAIDEYSYDSVMDAIKIARGSNIDHKPTWNYVASILKRRHEEAQQAKQNRADFDTATGPLEPDEYPWGKYVPPDPRDILKPDPDWKRDTSEDRAS